MQSLIKGGKELNEYPDFAPRHFFFIIPLGNLKLEDRFCFKTHLTDIAFWLQEFGPAPECHCKGHPEEKAIPGHHHLVWSIKASAGPWEWVNLRVVYRTHGASGQAGEDE